MMPGTERPHAESVAAHAAEHRAHDRGSAALSCVTTRGVKTGRKVSVSAGAACLCR
jgi:hypothetical protein